MNAELALAAPADGLVVLQAPTRRLAKLIQPDGSVAPAELARVFTAIEAPVDNLEKLGKWLGQLVARHDAMVVRGTLVGGPGIVHGIVRRSRPGPNGEAPTIADAPRRWVAIDLDNVPLPADIVPADLQACGHIARAMLPEEFRQARCIVQASGGHGLKPGARLRLWFWLSRPVTTAECRAWLSGSAADSSIYSPEHAVYTAAPVRADGRGDHLPSRLSALGGDPAVMVPTIGASAARKPLAAHPLPPIGDVEAALELIPNAELDWKRWCDIGLAVWAATGGSSEGLEAFERWSDKCPVVGQETPEERWIGITSSPPGQVSFGSLVHRARQVVPDWMPPSRRRIEAVDEFIAEQELLPGQAADGLKKTDPGVPFVSEDRLAAGWSKLAGDRFLACGGNWLTRIDHLYVEDTKGAVLHSVRGFAKQVSDMLLAKDEDRPAERVASLKTCRAIISFAAADPRHAVTRDEFDVDPWLLNTPAGVVDLRSGELRAQHAGERFLKSTSVAPDGECPRWLSFLSEATNGDADFVDYLARWAGYSLTGIIREHALPFLSGPGGNGKGTFIHMLAEAVGNYGTTAQPDLLTESHGDQHPAHLAALLGARLVTIGETPDGRPWAETRLKSLTGGDRISARFMRQDLFEFKPTAKIWITGNRHPPLRNVDAAMKRRLHVVPFAHTPKQINLQLEDALRSELGGILAWAIQGCAAWQSRGLAMPRVVETATREYFDDQDSLGAWLAASTVSDPDGQVPASAAFASWSGFASSRHESARSIKWFSPALVARGIEKKKTCSGMVFRGLTLKQESDDFPNS